MLKKIVIFLGRQILKLGIKYEHLLDPLSLKFVRGTPGVCPRFFIHRTVCLYIEWYKYKCLVCFQLFCGLCRTGIGHEFVGDGPNGVSRF